LIVITLGEIKRIWHDVKEEIREVQTTLLPVLGCAFLQVPDRKNIEQNKGEKMRRTPVETIYSDKKQDFGGYWRTARDLDLPVRQEERLTLSEISRELGLGWSSEQGLQTLIRLEEQGYALEDI
jgi:hypothetical protein